MGELAAENLHGQGIGKVTVINRTYLKAKELADRFSGEARSLNQLESALAEADILISSTGASEFVVLYQLGNDELLQPESYNICYGSVKHRFADRNNYISFIYISMPKR